MQRSEITKWITQLPPLPESIQKIETEFTKNTSVEPNSIVSIVESDPALTADILSYVNSPYFHFSKKIYAVDQATALLGVYQIRKLALKSAIFRSFDIDMSGYGLTNDEYMKICSFQSDLVFRWYMAIDIEKAKILMPIAFMLEVGSVVISRYVLDNNLKESFLKNLKNLDIKEAEIRSSGMSSIQINYTLFEHWNLDTIFIETMHYLDDQNYKTDFYVEELANALKAVRKVVNLRSQFEQEEIVQAADFLSSKGIEPTKFIKTCQNLAQKFQEL